MRKGVLSVLFGLVASSGESQVLAIPQGDAHAFVDSIRTSLGLPGLAVIAKLHAVVTPRLVPSGR